MSELWEERTDYKRIDAKSGISGDIEGYLPYKRLYKNLNPNQLQELLQDAKRLHWQVLDLSHTQISTLPASIGNLTNLQVLDLNDTQISTLPDSIGNLTNLQELYLEWTPINILPDSIGNLTNLQELYLNETPINILPDSIGNLTNLQELYLNKTPISTLPASIGSLTNLRRLNLHDTPFSRELSSEILNYDAQELIRYILNMQSTNAPKKDVATTLPVIPEQVEAKNPAWRPILNQWIVNHLVDIVIAIILTLLCMLFDVPEWLQRFLDFLL